MKKKRLGAVLREKGLIAEHDDPFVIVTEGRVFVDGQKAISPAQMVSDNAEITVRPTREYVGRGAYKLEAALEKFGVDVAGKMCADIGAATGGFTEVLLRRGAVKVYAIDTARGKLALKLRRDPRVVVMEETDVRKLESLPGSESSAARTRDRKPLPNFYCPALPEVVAIVTIDVSLISLRQILPAVRRFLSKDGIVVALFKPQYETRDPSILRHGVVKDDGAREGLVRDLIRWVETHEWRVERYIESPIRGSKGNVEYLLYLKNRPYTSTEFILDVLKFVPPVP